MDSSRVAVLVADALASADLIPLRAAGFTVVERPEIREAELLDCIGEFDALLVRSRTRVTGDLLSRAKRLRVVGRAGTGVDNVDVDAATALGVLVMNVPGGNAVAASEHTLALLFALARSIPLANQSLRAGKWERSAFTGSELRGRTLGVIGLGRIGLLVARGALGIGMKVLGYDPQLSKEVAEDHGVEPAGLDDLLSRSHAVTVHVPLNEATRHLLNRERLSALPEGAWVLNVARGGIVDEDALLSLLEEGRIGGAGLDVFESEPPSNPRLIGHPRVVATPHLGASTREAQSGVSRAIAGQVAAFLSEGAVANAVNLPGARSANPELAPWRTLARRLGGIAASLLQEGPRRVEAVLTGDLHDLSPEEVLREALVGVQIPFAGEPVNVVNAEVRARSRGIAFHGSRRARHPSFHALLRVSVDDGHGGVRLSGTLFGRRHLRIVRAFGCNMDAIPEGPMLWVSQEDRPGLIAHIGGVLARAGINIDNMSVGRAEESGLALSVLNLRTEPPEEVLQALRSHPDVRWALPVPARAVDL